MPELRELRVMRNPAVTRGEVYRIVNRRAPLALDANRAWLVKWPLDWRAMHEAAQVLVGRHDFTTLMLSGVL